MFLISGCGAVLVARLNGVQEAAGSTPVTRTRIGLQNRCPRLKASSHAGLRVFRSEIRVRVYRGCPSPKETEKAPKAESPPEKSGWWLRFFAFCRNFLRKNR